MNKSKKAAPKTADQPKIESGGTASAGKFVIAALGHGYLTGNAGWSHNRADAMELNTYEMAETALKARRTQAGFPQHAAVSPGQNSAAATLDPGARVALAQLFPRLQEVAVKGSPYTLLEPKAGIKPKDLTVAERAAMAERHAIVGPKLPKYVPKVSGMGDAVKNAKAAAPQVAPKSKRSKMMPPGSAISKETREKMNAVGDGARKIMEKAEAERKKEAKKPKAGSDGKTPKKTGGPKARGIGVFCERLLAKRKSAEEILAAVRKEFPGAKTSMASIAWYRNKMAQEGTLPKN